MKGVKREQERERNTIKEAESDKSERFEVLEI